jgi:hypothetical protein
MTRNPYDQAAKELCKVALSPYGRVIVQQEVQGEPQWVDVLVDRALGSPAPPGLLGRMVDHTCLLEMFHDPPGLEPIRDCLCKQLLLHRERRVPARDLGDPSIVPLWIISGGRPESVLRAYALHPRSGWPRGVYGTAEGYGWSVVVTSELPAGIDTLLVRLMGSGETLRRAVRDLRALDRDSPEGRAGAAAVNVLRWSRLVEAPLGPIQETIAMEVRETYEEWMSRARQEGRAEAILHLFARKLGRRLAEPERAHLLDRIARLGPDRIGDVVLDFDATALAAWLADPAAC